MESLCEFHYGNTMYELSQDQLMQAQPSYIPLTYYTLGIKGLIS